MKNRTKKIIALLFLLMIIFVSGCGTGHVSVGVYVPGAWVGPYGGGYYPPVGMGYPIY